MSTSALGKRNLKEAGVLLEPGELDINQLLSSIKKRPVSDRELSDLDYAHREYHTRNKLIIENPRIPSFGEWYELPFQPKWKLFVGTSAKVSQSSSAKEILKSEYGVTRAYDWRNAVYKNDYRKHDWILCFNFDRHTPQWLRWMFVDFVVSVSRSDKKAYLRGCPYQIIQTWSLRHYPPPPFQIDGRFRDALKRAIREFGAERIWDTVRPPKSLLSLIHKHYSG